MKRVTANVLGLALVGLAVVSTSSCGVNRRSSTYACDSDSDCEADRMCSRGFCVERTEPGPVPGPTVCPPGCTSCDLDDLDELTCEIDCTGDLACPLVTCPPGFACTIQCMGNQACGPINCAVGTECAITCMGDSACPIIECSGACDIECRGQAACGFVACQDACRCDQDCSSPSACGVSSCPVVRSGVCSEDDVEGAPCDSFADRTCDRCP